MARHSHWAQIKLKKGALDKKRGKLFTKHAHLIEIATRRGGGDPNMNASLRLSIDNARADNMPRENIERAIKKGIGEIAGGSSEEIIYEGYGPGGVALMIETLTDNKNRTSQKLRTLLQKHGGSLGEVGCTSFMFEKKGVLHVKAKTGSEADQLEIIDISVEDVQEISDGFLVYTPVISLAAVKKNLEQRGFIVESSELSFVPKNVVHITDTSDTKKLLALMEALDEEDDVNNISANFDIADNA